MSEYKDVAPAFREAMIERARDAIPFWSLLGMEVVDIKKGWAKIRIPFLPKLANANGFVHGGAIFSAADSAVGTALVGMVEKEDFITTVEMKINYLKPAKGREIVAEAQIIHRGSVIATGDVEVKDAAGNVIARALATYAIVKNGTPTRPVDTT